MEILATVLKRNALRREAKLPSLDVRMEFEQAVQNSLWKDFVRLHCNAARADVLRGCRRRLGSDFPTSAGGRWHVNILTGLALQTAFAATRVPTDNNL